MFKYILFDLDETLYPTTNGLMKAMGQRIRDFIQNKYLLSPEAAEELQKRYWIEYGTTLRGLYTEHKVDPADFLAYVHDVDVTKYIAPDPRLRQVLQEIPQEKVILTNADVPHARRVLERLGVSDQFTRILDVVAMEYECKPAPSVYRRALSVLDVRGEECVLVEDQARNLQPARALGIKTVLVYSPDCPVEADLCLPDIYQIADAIKQLETAVPVPPLIQS